MLVLAVMVGHVALEVVPGLPRHALDFGLGDVALVVVAVDVGGADFGLARRVGVGARVVAVGVEGLVGHFGCG